MYVLAININGRFSNYLAGKKKSYSKMRKFDVVETCDIFKAMIFKTKEDAEKYARESTLTLNYYPVKI